MTLAQLLAAVQTAIETRKEVESRLSPLKTEYEQAMQAESTALMDLETYRRNGLIILAPPPTVNIRS